MPGICRVFRSQSYEEALSFLPAKGPQWVPLDFVVVVV